MTRVSEKLLSPLPKSWVTALAKALFNQSLPGELEDFSAHEKRTAKHFVATTIAKRRPKNPAIDLESFAAPDGRRQLRVAIANDNMPFLVDSVTAVLAKHGLIVARLLHPVILAERDADGVLTSIGKRGITESIIYLECDRGDARTRMAIRRELRHCLAQARAAVSDWSALQTALSTDAKSACAQSAEFLAWAAEGAFTLLGAADYAGKSGLSRALGIARDLGDELLFSEMRARALSLFQQNGLDLLIIKSNLVSPVHRAVPLDLLIVPLREGKRVSGIRMYACLWTSAALSLPPDQVPLLRQRLADLQRKHDFDPTGHAGKALTNALTELPHDLALSIDEASLEHLVLSAMSVADRPRVKVDLVAAPLFRHLFGFVWLPRDELTTARRHMISEILTVATGGRLISWSVALGESGTALLRYVFDIRKGLKPVDKPAIEVRIDELLRGWSRGIESQLATKTDPQAAARLTLRFAPLFPQAYRDRTPIEEAALDLLQLAGLFDADQRSARIFRISGEEATLIHLKLFARHAVALSDAVPVLENFGFHVFEEVPTRLTDAGGHIHDFTLGLSDDRLVSALAECPSAIEAALCAVLEGSAENDRFNALLVAAALSTQQVLLFRALFRYLRQTGMSYGLLTVVEALRRYPAIAQQLAFLFTLRNDPAHHSVAKVARANDAIDALLTGVAGIEDDRILRQFRAVIMATLRTNLFAPAAKEALAFKFESALIPGLPAPVPWREIFVYSPRIEGIHLRAGPIARGGLRWSDRRDDFRTEILGLMKAQRVKNAVIVPTGAKGGFYPKLLGDPADREAWLSEGTESYRIFIRTLLSVTDNLVGGKVVKPEAVICHDGDDPYFVVAADKGTSTFSDVANAIALQKGFWLGDAFASGGSVGYDHKAMGITARGGWVSVARHFAEMGIDIQSQPVRVVGCGDMSGDVFGNGMLLSRSIKLVAAFDHRHIFIDPDPDPQGSWAERERLFKLPRSSWADYDTKLISKGGGIFARSAKQISLSPQAQSALGLASASFEPTALIAEILKSPVDLIWFGGIGTYVKAAAENNADAGDRANDACRVNAENLRCKVIGEGANLGMTQAARIAFAIKGGRINTDFIDNSAGVDCSDNEVNIKIALDSELSSSKLTPPARNRLLARMTQNVADLVLEDNRLQTLALSMAERDGVGDLPAYVRVIEGFEAQGLLDRKVEGLSTNDDYHRRATSGQGLTRPELAVILSTAKIALQDAIEISPLGRDGATRGDLLAAFPAEMRRRHVGAIEAHPLRNEIVATKLANRIINRLGIIRPFELAEEEGTTLGSVAEAFVIAEQLFGIAALWKAIDTAAISEATRLMLYEQVAIELRAHMADILRNAIETRSNEEAIAAYAPTIKKLSDMRAALLPPEARRQTSAYGERLIGALAPAKIANALVRLAQLDGAIGISALSTRSKVDPVALTKAFTALGDALGLDWAQGVTMQLDPLDPWERLLAAGVGRDFQAMRLNFLDRLGGKAPARNVETWLRTNAQRVALFRSAIDRARTAGSPTPAMLAQLASQARALLGSS